MTIEEQIARLDQLIAFVEKDLPRYAEQVAATDLAALVASRVIDTGKTYTGGTFKPYSTNTIAAWRFWGKSRNQSAEKKVRALASKKDVNGKRVGGALSYADFRKLNNLNTDKKNFEFSGEMWKKFGVIKAVNVGLRFKITIGGKTPAAQEKIDENSRREGISIIEASQDERDTVALTAQDWLEEQAERILNG